MDDPNIATNTLLLDECALRALSGGADEFWRCFEKWQLVEKSGGIWMILVDFGMSFGILKKGLLVEKSGTFWVILGHFGRCPRFRH